MNDELEVKTTSCPGQTKRTGIVASELGHLRVRLAQRKIAPLVQFVVYTYNCSDKSHASPDEFHIDFASVGSSLPVPGALQVSIAAVEQLLAALKAKLQ